MRGFSCPLTCGSLRQAARKLRVSYSTLRGWLGRRCEEPPEGDRDLLAEQAAAMRAELDAAAEHLATVRGNLPHDRGASHGTYQ
ncbi:hypothetical protein [Haliangium ochraceum]|uniref:Transposase n=1 Tax=Haliangium ochraceum (strain DSM 14365 / JCM 11303 / SMP-2) TaxID=502025 RepID=D0LQT6_HALO1|nr:hypothetical protein [Haliangium ochraceum]ACY13646.1 hypothetical protein Hoch_1054 [Haliangium ochraceum DSM 14365]